MTRRLLHALVSRTALATAAAALLTTAAPAAAFTQNVELEAKLNSSHPQALALFPANGYRDGAAGFFRANGLQIVPDSERAWCQNQSRGILKGGCYVEWFFHRRGYNLRTWDGEPCGHLARWYQAPGTNKYLPTTGSPFADAIARGDMGMLDLELDSSMPVQLRDVRRLMWCATKTQGR